MAGKIEITASMLIALASFTTGHAMASGISSDAPFTVDDLNTTTRSMAAGTMLDGRATLQPRGQQQMLLAQAQEPPAAEQPDPELLLKKKREAEGEKHEPPKPHEEKPAPEAPKPELQQPEPPKPEPKHVEPPAPKAEPVPAAPEAPKPKAPDAAPPQAAPPEGKHHAPDAEKPQVAPKPPVEAPVEAKEPPAAKPVPEKAPETVKPEHKHKEPQPPKAEKAPAPAEVAPPVEKPAEKPVPQPKPPAAAPAQEAPPAKAEEKPAAPTGEKPPVVEAPTEPTKAPPAPAKPPAEPNKAAAPQAVAPAGEAPVKQRPPKAGKPDAPAAQAAPAAATAPGTPPPVPPAPAPGDTANGNKAPAAILPPLNTVQSRDPNQPAQGGQGGRAGQGGLGGKPGRQGQPGQAVQPAQVPEATRPQFSQEQKQPFTPKELQRLKALAARPDQSNDTIVLPVDNGAPVLDSDKDANWRRGMSEDQLRRLRKQSAQDWNYAVPQSDKQAQREYFGNRQRPPVEMEPIDQDRGRRLQQAPRFLYPEDVRAGQEFDGDRRVMDYDGQIVVRGDDTRRFEQYGRPVVYEQIDHQRIRATVFKKNGDRIVTVRNRYGQLIQRSRVDADGREVVLFYSPDLYAADDSRQVIYRDPGASLPPMRLRVPLSDYIVDVGSQPNRDYYDFIEQPPVEPVERVYTLDEVRNSARIRDKMRRIDLDTIIFATGSWDISLNQAGTLKGVANAMSEVLRKNPSETFLIEGHTDAVGSAESNLVLSDRRAEAVANVLTQVYGIAPENMVTQGYGEQFLKVMTYGPEQQNRRVTIRRITPLVRPIQ